MRDVTSDLIYLSLLPLSLSNILVCLNGFTRKLTSFQIPIVLYKDEDKDERGNPAIGPDGKPRYRCGFRIGGGIDQDNTKSPQGYPDKVYQCYS